MGSRSPMGMGNFKGAKGQSIVKYSKHTATICGKTSEHIKMPFGLCTQVSSRNHVLYGAQIPIQRANY